MIEQVNMVIRLSLFGVAKAPLNSDIQFFGLKSLMGVGRAYVLLMYLINLVALRIICHVVAPGQTELREVFYTGVACDICGLVISEGTSRYLGMLSIVPIYVATVIIVSILCGLGVQKAALIALLYYVYHAASLALLKMLWHGVS